MSVLTVKPKFLYPHSRRFPFDEVSEKIVRAIEKRNWKVPGITVEFQTYGSGEAIFQYVKSIVGDNFKLEFGRSQASIKDFDGTVIFNDAAALRTAYIPKQGLQISSVDSYDVSYFLYIGENWDKDKHQFMDSFNSFDENYAKKYNKPRTCLLYIGSYVNFKSTELIAESYCGRYCYPERNEPTRINLEQTFKTFVSWLEEYVLNYIISFPESDTIETPQRMEELIPYKGPWPNVFCICNKRDAERIQEGKVDPNILPPESRYVPIYNTMQLVHSFVKSNGRFPDLAYEFFIWCNVNQEINSTDKDFLSDIFYRCDYIVSLKLKYANGIYVVDNAKYTETLEKILETIAPRTYLTKKELGEALAARVDTLIPISEYKGDYKKPFVLIGRELDFDEVGWLAPIRHN